MKNGFYATSVLFVGKRLVRHDSRMLPRLIGLIGLFVFLLAGQVLGGPKSRPNVVLIFTDDQGMHDVGCYGSEIATPHIDSLAQDGMKFTQWYVASSICTPSRFGLLTGQFPTRSRDGLLCALMFLGDK